MNVKKVMQHATTIVQTHLEVISAPAMAMDLHLLKIDFAEVSR